jgi:hypothetical protein
MDGGGFDREMLIKLLGLMGSAYDAEALLAARKANDLVRCGGMTWIEVLQPHDELQVAIAAAQQLRSENERLKAEIKRIAAGADGASDWQPVSNGIIATGTAHQQARWALQLWAAKRVNLSDLEHQVLEKVGSGDGKLSTRDKLVFDRLITRVGERAKARAS